MNIRSLSVAFAAFALAGLCRAEEQYTLTTDDFSSAKVSLVKIDAAGVTVSDPIGQRVLPLAHVVSLAKQSTKPDTISGLVLCTAGGDRLVGTPQKLEGNNIVWFASGVGSVSVPLDQCTGVLRDKTSSADLSSNRAEDQAKLVTGDTVKGIVTDITDKGFVLTPQQGDPVTLSPDSIASLLFATPPGGRKVAPPAGFVVHVTGGTSVSCSAVTEADSKLALTLPGGRNAVIPMTQVTAIENANGAVSWLSSRQPVASEYTPFFQGNFPAQFDRSVVGEPIRFGGVTYRHGIGVHSRSKLTFAVQPGDATFRTRYALDGNLGYGDVNVRVRVDDKVIHEAKDFHSGVLSPVVQADVSGAKTVTLEVDFGGAYDVQDRLNWIEPAMLRSAATTQP